MIRITEIKLPLNHRPDEIEKAILQKLAIPKKELIKWAVFKRGHDARKRNNIQLIYTIVVNVENEELILKKFEKDHRVSLAPNTEYHYPVTATANSNERPIIIGMGPCGIFAALALAEMGFKPILIERGKKVKARTVDTFGFWKKGVLNPESNVQFGEGGAGTFSDGKLHTGIKDKRFIGRKVIKEFIKAGAPEEILTISKPHIGTLKLVKVVENMRNTILSLGGEIKFESKVTDLIIEDKQIKGVVLSTGEEIASKHVVLAIGHSARDTFKMIHERGVYIESKPFSMGFRIEHPQPIIDACRFGENAGNKILGSADYKLVHHCKNGRSVYSFCMCPGGTVVAAASEIGGVVTNGMSQYSRNAGNANSAIVVDITPEDYPNHPLAGVEFQRKWEQKAFTLGGETYDAPGQLVGDFLAAKPSTHIGKVPPSYRPGIRLTDLSTALPDYIIESIREAIPAFDKKIPGFNMPDAVLTGNETRTSSPIRIKRGKDFQSINTKGLYPAGEGAGYAGGILSASVDGIKVAEAIAIQLTKK
jgi:uncharacterized protein